MKAVVTVAVGDRGDAIHALTEPILRQYARRIGADFVCIREPRIGAGHPKFEKLQIHDLLARYARIVYLDADILVMPGCPDLFQLVPEDCFGAYFDSNGGNGDAEEGLPDVRGEEIDSYQRLCGPIGWRRTYFNSGVMVASARHRSMFRYDGEVRKSARFVDQTFLNYRLQQAGFRWMDIGQKFNHFAAFNRSLRLYCTRFDSHIIHYAGFEEFYPDHSLEDQIRGDIAVAYPEPEAAGEDFPEGAPLSRPNVPNMAGGG